MPERPDLNRNLDENTFHSYYYLKKELVDFCRANGLPSSGGKIEITNRIAYYLNTNNVLPTKAVPKLISNIGTISEDSKIESNFVCSEKHRAFFIEKIGKSFSFNVAFQKWLKNNYGKKYSQAIEAYYQILNDKKNEKPKIDKQFEYNTYIRDFFESNKGYSLKDAIKCWKYKKNQKGHNRYEKPDLDALM